MIGVFSLSSVSHREHNSERSVSTFVQLILPLFYSFAHPSYFIQMCIYFIRLISSFLAYLKLILFCVTQVRQSVNVGNSSDRREQKLQDVGLNTVSTSSRMPRSCWR